MDKNKDFIAFDDNGEVEDFKYDVTPEPKVAHVEEAPLVQELPLVEEIKEAPAEPETNDMKEDVLKASHETKHESKHKEKKAKEKTPYVTKSFMVVCLIIAVIVSTLMGAGLAMQFGGTAKKYSNLSDSSLSNATGSKLTVSQIVAKNADAVVEIVVEATTMGMFGEQQISEGAGSGVIVNEKGFIVTNYHVVEGANSVQVTLHNGESYKASIVGGDNANDIAVLKINAEKLNVATVGDSSTLAVGDLAVAIGNPLGQLGGTATTGIVSALDRRLTIENRTLTLIQTDAAINPGNSGGGLFNGAGELIGIVDAKSSGTDVEGLAFAIPINTVKDEIDSLIKDGKVKGKPSIGISIYDVSEDNAQYYNLDGEGVYVAEVTGDNATKAGLKEGDKILKFNNSEIDNSSDLISKVRECKVGDTVTLQISRNGQKMTIKTKLEESVENNLNK